jgi:trk system potassium uptake protein TrkA
MYVVIAGASKLSYRLVQTLLQGGHEVTLIEKDRAKADHLALEFGPVVLPGDATSVRTLREAGANRADVVLATTEFDEINLVICQVAKVVFVKPRTIAIIRNPVLEGLFEGMGVDLTLNTTAIINSYVSEMVDTSNMLTPLLTLKGGGFELVQFELREASPAAHRTIAELKLPPDTVLVAIQRGDHIAIPQDSTMLKPDDVVIALVARGQRQALRQLL